DLVGTSLSHLKEEAYCKPWQTPTNANNYRPIALTSFQRKLMELMINTGLISILEKENPYSSFNVDSVCRCTRDNALILETAIRDAFVRSSHFI
ncbi:hypothetical protein CEXT_610941, partial [Caerostris extrusa]